MNKKLDVLIIGAGFSGISVAAGLKQYGVDNFAVLEKGETVGTIWKTAYDRLVIQNPYFSLLFFKGNSKYSVFKTKDEVIEYLTEYANHFQVYSHIRFNEEVQNVIKFADSQQGEYWQVETSKGILKSQILVICTGLTNEPIVPDFNNQNFPGQILHSSQYQNGIPFKNKKVLVVGSGNSAAEIALDLHEYGAAKVDMLIRSKRWVFPLYYRLRILEYWLFKLRSKVKLLFQVQPDKSELIEKSIRGSLENLQIAIQKKDRWVKYLALDLSRYSIYKDERGPIDLEVNEGRVAWVDRGTVKLIKKGYIGIISESIQKLTANGVVFADGKIGNYDAIILGTGFRPSINKIFKHPELFFNPDDRFLPITDDKCQSIVDCTLYFVGFEKTIARAGSYSRYGWYTGKRIAAQLQTSII